MSTYWAMWGVTAGVLALVVLRAIRQSENLAGLPLVAAAMWSYFYVFMAAGTATELSTFLPEWAWETGQLAALSAFLGLYAGWYVAARTHNAAVERPDSGRPYKWGELWCLGAFLTLVGAGANYAFMRQQDIDWQGSSAYWYLAFHIGYPGMALCVVARVKGRFQHPLERLAFVALTVLAMYPHVAAARRGPLFPMVMVLAFLPALLRNGRPNRMVLLGALAGAGVLMLVFVAVRPIIYREGARAEEISSAAWMEAVSTVTADQVLLGRAKKAGDNEFLYHCGQIATNVELSAYQYGSGYLTLLTHWIPRRWWPAKPSLGQGWYADILELMPVVVGWRVTAGASAGGVAEVFNQFGWYGALFWALISWAAGKIFMLARTSSDPRSATAYIGILCASHWLVSQGFAAAFVPAVIYQVVPWVAYRICGRAPAARRAAPAIAGQGVA